MTGGGEHRATSRAGQLAIDALEWQASGEPYPPASIRGLSTTDQAALAREAHRVVSASEAAAARVARATDEGRGPDPT